MKNYKYLIFGGVIAAVILVFIIVLLIIKKLKSKQKDTFLSPKCVKNPMKFTDTNAKSCNNSGTGTPPYILFIRHCDRGYPTIPSKKPYIPQASLNGKPGTKIRTTCATNPNTCEGCQYQESENGCASNLCSQEGIERSWALGKWIDCFAKSKDLHIAAVIGQSFESSKSNARPLTTASIILDSLTNLGRSPCYLMSDRSDFSKVKTQINTSGFSGQIVVVVWDHGELGELITAVTGVSKDNPNIHWTDCCFDQVVVIDTTVVPIGATAYNAQSLNDNGDNCGTSCVGKSPYTYTLNNEKFSCSAGNFSNKSHPTLC